MQPVWYLSGENGKERAYLVNTREMPEAGWKVELLTPLDRIQKLAFLTVIFATIIYLVLLLLALYLFQLAERKKEKKAFEAQARVALSEANDRLEKRVKERTRDLRNEIHERERTEKMLRQTQGELIHAAKLATLGQMSTSISHELNQPLAAIRSYADNARMLIDHDRVGDARKNLIEITGLTERMAQISSQLKLYARKDSGKIAPVPLAEIIDASLHLLKPGLAESGTSVRLRLPDEGIAVMADPVRLEQVFVNLLSNAIHAMSGVEFREIEIAAEAQRDGVRVRVSDSGTGISEECLARIFDPFFTTRESGLGLGLAISLRIMEGMGGSLTAGNLSGKGAVFELKLRGAKTNNA
ncbi:MAG TPA: sensor histidine kinase [Gammaproteobacteria bacterium]|nr:sensor histidine kinase [Gammaproteobacteria bacterium]